VTGSAATKAADAAETLLAWLNQSQHPAVPAEALALQDVAEPPGRGPRLGSAGSVQPEPCLRGQTRGDHGTVEPSPRASPSLRPQPPLRLAHTDWLHHRLTISGPAGDLVAFRKTAAGAGTVPWRLDLDRTEEDLFHLLVSPPPPQQRTLSLAGARILARQLRDAVALRHELAVARVGRSRACPFDLHALVPVPEDVLRLGPDDPDSLAWLWEHWGTTRELRQVAETGSIDPDLPLGSAPPESGTESFCVNFVSADWTPWRALAQFATDWPALHVDIRPIYGTK
jgi:hypothetical protein